MFAVKASMPVTLCLLERRRSSLERPRIVLIQVKARNPSFSYVWRMENSITRPAGPDDAEFIRRIAIAGILILLGFAVWRLADVLLLIFAAILFAVALRGLSTRLNSLTGMGFSLSLIVVLLLVGTIVAFVFWAFGAQIASQYDEIVERIPAAIAGIAAQFRTHPIARYLVEPFKSLDISTATAPIASALARAMSSIAQGLSYAAFVIFGGIYLAADPARYRAGLLRLIPRSRRGRYGQLLRYSGQLLERWLLGQLVVMVTIGALSGFGLWALGIDAPFALGLTGGLLCFVPFVGAILAAVPATLMAFAQSPIDALYTILLFIGVHLIEGNFITPLVQDKAVALAPVIAVFSTLIFTILFGPFAVMVAVPITIVLLAMLEMLYVEDVLRESPSKNGLARPPADTIHASSAV